MLTLIRQAKTDGALGVVKLARTKPPTTVKQLAECLTPVFDTSETEDLLSRSAHRAARLGDSEELNDGWLGVLNDRTELAWRKLRGEALTEFEELRLQVLNDIAKRMAPPPPELSQRAQDALALVDLL